ncbi:glycosyltransferase family protein [Thermodesulfobacteriota bacterium]
MARIFYGVMGDARGHVNRALTIVKEMPEHEFLFFGGGRVLDLVQEGYQVEEAPMPSTFYRGDSVDLPATILNAVKVFMGRRGVIDRAADIIKDFDPDLVLTDYEFFTPLAARKLGRTCVSVDHQHVLTHCAYKTPPEQLLSRMMTNFSVRHLYSNASLFVVISFFQIPAVDPTVTAVLPPVIRRMVTEYKPTLGDHVLVYQTSPTFHRTIPVLEELEDRFIIYGAGEQPSRKNLQFKKPAQHGFLADLASARYVITNGGHNVISEALYLGKPVLSFPIVNAYEQFINAWFLARMEYGDYSTSPTPGKRVFDEFQSRLHIFRAGIEQGTFFGNEILARKLQKLVNGGI